jgi:hypothetical protein
MMLDILEWLPIGVAANKAGIDKTILLLMADQGHITLYARVDTIEVPENALFITMDQWSRSEYFDGLTHEEQKFIGLIPFPPKMLKSNSTEIYGGIDPEGGKQLVLVGHFYSEEEGEQLKKLYKEFESQKIESDLMNTLREEIEGEINFIDFTVTIDDLYVRGRDLKIITNLSAPRSVSTIKAVAGFKRDEINRERVQAVAQVIHKHLPDILPSEIAGLVEITDIACGRKVKKEKLMEWIKNLDIEQPDGSPPLALRSTKIEILRKK